MFFCEAPHSMFSHAMHARVNGQITASKVRLISEDGADLGVFSRADALELVRSGKGDLVEVDPDSTPPVCQVIDYGKYQYRLQQARKDRAHD
jgi:translation initiation factor IF-3